MKTTMRKLAMLTLIAVLFIAGNVGATETERKALIHESVEAELVIEDWMTDESVWNVEMTAQIEIEADFESKLEIENWMVDSNLWETNMLENDNEEELMVECWMISENFWNR